MDLISARRLTRKISGLVPGRSTRQPGIRGSAVTLPFLTGCTGAQSTLDPAGPSAQIIAYLWWGMFSFFTLVLLVVVALWIYAMRRKPRELTPDAARTLHKRWLLGGGIVLPAVSVITILAFGIPAGQTILLLPESDQPPLRVEVIAHRWWWEFRYPELGITTANQLYLPVDVPIDIHGTATDVIHAFWVPRLGGKIDLVPGRTNRLRLQAATTGSMRGQCTEFCGSGHAHMIFAVEIVDADQFDAWQQRRQRPVVVPEQHANAVAPFQENCGSCHTVTGISEGQGAPDLTEIGNRRLLGAGLQRNQQLSVEQWLSRHPTLSQGGDTPDHRQMVPDQRTRIAAWLETLGND